MLCFVSSVLVTPSYSVSDVCSLFFIQYGNIFHCFKFDKFLNTFLWLQGWCSGDNSLHPPLSPGFKSRRRRHVWVGFVVAGSLPCSERFFTWYSGFALSKNQHIQILIRPGIRQTKNHYVDVLHLNRHLVVYLFIIYLSKSIIVKNLLSMILPFLCNSFPLSYSSLFFPLSPPAGSKYIGE